MHKPTLILKRKQPIAPGPFVVVVAEKEVGRFDKFEDAVLKAASEVMKAAKSSGIVDIWRAIDFDEPRTKRPLQMREVEVADWDALQREIARIKGLGRDAIYRGVRNVNYEYNLTPTIGRPNARKNPKDGIPLPYSKGEEIQSLAFFRHEVRQRSKELHLRSEYTDIELLAIAQHHGAYTRLLDWTRNPLIATFFATETAGTTGPPAIYVLPDIPGSLGNDHPFSIADVRRYEPESHLDLPSRLSAQGSVLTVHPRPTEPYDSPNLEVWRFPAGPPSWELKQRIDKEFRWNRSSLFPDLDGLGAYSAWSYKWGKLPQDLT